MYYVLMLYETHNPRHGYKKIWPSSLWCPVCEKNGIIRDGFHRPFYIPKPAIEGGERIVIYTCTTCYARYSSLIVLTLQDLKDYHQCRLELEDHLNTLSRADS